MQIGDIGFIKNKSWISKFIRWWTTSQWSHVVVFVDNKGNMIEATWPRVREANINVYKGCYCEILSPELPLKVFEKNAMLSFLRSKIGKRYDWRGLIGFIIKSNIQKKNAYFCSELVGEAYKSFGRKLIRVPSEWMKPESIYESLKLKIISKRTL